MSILHHPPPPGGLISELQGVHKMVGLEYNVPLYQTLQAPHDQGLFNCLLNGSLLADAEAAASLPGVHIRAYNIKHREYIH